ncbi:ceramidase [Apiospora aurea]|uniref:Ceramidase n=1 Tax=Apiospora aurea TaxID=335848 RepID=A0ABR1QYZ4_9PEZI
MGHHNHDFPGDKYALTGLWGPPTSWANFCEEDYGVTRYTAEFINALSNIAYVYMALYYPGHHGHLGALLSLDSMSLSMILVGVTSTVFHGTMLLNAQLADELSMLFLATAILHRLYTVGRSPFAKQAATVFLLPTTTGLAVAYVKSGNVMYHVTIFGAQLTCIWPRTLYQIFAAERAAESRAKRLRQFGKAVVALAVGYALWYIDLEFCDLLRSWRQALGAP